LGPTPLFSFRLIVEAAVPKSAQDRITALERKLLVPHRGEKVGPFLLGRRSVGAGAFFFSGVSVWSPSPTEGQPCHSLTIICTSTTSRVGPDQWVNSWAANASLGLARHRRLVHGRGSTTPPVTPNFRPSETPELRTPLLSFFDLASVGLSCLCKVGAVQDRLTRHGGTCLSRGAGLGNQRTHFVEDSSCRASHLGGFVQRVDID
jgi:hypothetical protein